MERNGQVYDSLQNLHKENGLLITPAELQGMIFGYLIAMEEPCFKTWTQDLQDTLNWDHLSEPLKDAIKQLFLSANMEITQNSQTLSFVVPQSTASSSEQLTALSDWARGCLYGIGLGNLSSEFFENPELEEAINDLVQIAQIDLDLHEEDQLQEDLEYCFKHIGAIIALLHSASQESLEEEEISSH